MSKRGKVDDILKLHDEEDGFYLGRIDSLGASRGDECPQSHLSDSRNQGCIEWPNVEILNDDKTPTGEYVYHISKCDMQELNAGTVEINKGIK
jgi:hypothetical protein